MKNQQVSSVTTLTEEDVYRAMLLRDTFTFSELSQCIARVYGIAEREAERCVRVVLARIKKTHPCLFGKPLDHPPEGEFEYQVSESARSWLTTLIRE